MRWRQFLTPVKSIDATQARLMIEGTPKKEMTVLDVRQPGEYEGGHVPGAKLVPLPELNARLDELDNDKSTLVYCAVGGRSRVAAQMLAGKGFKDVLNLTGGFKAWTGKSARGGEDFGMEIFSGEESPEKALIIAYSLEEGLREFYIAMSGNMTEEKVQDLFRQLSQIEEKHKSRVWEEYRKITGEDISQKNFENNLVADIREGGLTTEEYYEYFKSDWETVDHIIGAAMGIEAQALDLYQRAAEKTKNTERKQALIRLADEEQVHLSRLGETMDTIHGERR